MAQTQQGKKHASFRAISGTSGTFNGDAMAAMAVELTAAGRKVPATFNGRMIAWLRLRTGSSESNINALMNLFAQQEGAANWSALGEFGPAAPPAFVQWRFDDGEGSVLTDYSGNGHHGELDEEDAPTWVSEGLSFGDGGSVRVPAFGETWSSCDIVFKPASAISAATNPGQCLIGKVDSGVILGAAAGGINSEIISVKQNTVDGYDATAMRSWTDGSASISDDWHVVQCNMSGDAAGWHIILDATRVDDETRQNVAPVDAMLSGVHRIGNNAGEVDRPFAGTIAWINLYRVGRTDTQMADARTALATALADRGITLP